ncbi:class I adenylate-forming enzyme family protein [Thermoplasma sp.]|uniref:class I adenylate-forming enzyme family protein n=1 Tax=Thermoplasma sp. TaxID=1973142 RepID=UPI0026118E76|nr:class I adenylate-forming enzyme family protein [Thermoplasma sp.]
MKTNTGMVSGMDQSLYDAFAKVSEDNQSKVAIYFLGKPLTYHDVRAMSDSLAHNLEEMGVSGRIAIMAGNSPQFVISLLAINSMGLEAALLRPGESPEAYDCQYVIASDYMMNYQEFNFRDMFLIRDEDLAPYGTSLKYYFREYLGERRDLSSRPGVHKLSDLIFDRYGQYDRDRSPDDTFIVKKTRKMESPVLIRNKDIMSAIADLSAYLDGFRKNMLISSSLYHMSTLQFLFTALINAGTVNLVPDYMDGQTSMKLAGRLESNMVVGNSHLYRQIVEKKIGIPKTIRFLFMIGEDFAPEFMDRFRSATGRTIKVGFDMTESCGAVTISPLDSEYDGSIGKPLPNVKIRITDRSGKDVQPGEMGFIEVSPGRFMGAESQYYNTGDLGYIDAGGGLHLERTRRMIINGSLIDPEPIEAAVNKASGVNDIAIGMRYEGGLPVLVAYVVTEDVNGIKRFFESRFPPYLRPQKYIAVKKIPRSPAGKIIRDQIIEIHGGDQQKASAEAN